MQRNHAQKLLPSTSHYVHLDIYYREERAQPQKAIGNQTPDTYLCGHDGGSGYFHWSDRRPHGCPGPWNNTYLILMSDNGGRNTYPGPCPTIPRNHPLRDGKIPFTKEASDTLHVAGPQIKANSVSHVPITGLDILPTLADLAGYPLPLPKRWTEDPRAHS